MSRILSLRLIHAMHALTSYDAVVDFGPPAVGVILQKWEYLLESVIYFAHHTTRIS